MHTLHRHHSGVAFLALLLPVGAQSGGPTTALGHGFSIDGATPIAPYTAASVIQVSTDFESAAPLPYTPPPGVADFNLLPIPAALDVDALSIGLDWVVSNGAGVAVVPPGQWAAITWTVSRGTAGAPASLVASEVAAPDGAAGDVFAYVLPGSALPPPIVGVPLRAQDSTEISVFTPGIPGNLDAHDLFIGLIYRDNPQIAATLPPPTAYFSVSDATKGSIPAAWAAPALRSGATVFSTTWVPGTGSWSPVTVAYAPSAFGLMASEDIDGIAVDLVRGEVLLSCDPGLSPGRDPLLWSALGSGSNTPYVLPGGSPPVKVSAAIGLGGLPDDLDGVCALDPGTVGSPHQAQLHRVVGRWRNPLLPTANNDLQASLVRVFDQPSQREFLVSFMTGWPQPAPGLPGFALCALTVAPPQVGPYVTIDFHFRPDIASPYVQFEGHPERCEWLIPPGFGGLPITLVWLAGNNFDFALSHPITITL